MTFCNSSITYRMKPKQKQISFIKIPKQEGTNIFLKQEDETHCISAPKIPLWKDLHKTSKPE